MTGLDCIAVVKALGEKTRLLILQLLFKETPAVNALAERLRIMRAAGLLEAERWGPTAACTVAPKLKKPLAAHGNVLDLGCCTFRFNQLPR